MTIDIDDPRITLAGLGITLKTSDFSSQFLHQTDESFWLRLEDPAKPNVLVTDFMFGKLSDGELALILLNAFRSLGKSLSGNVIFRDVEPGGTTDARSEDLRVFRIVGLAAALNAQRVNSVSDQIERGKRNLVFRLSGSDKN